MSGVNKAIIVGRLGKDPEVRYTPGGQAVANFPVATSENWQDKEGQRQERTEWHRIVVWGKLAELCGQYLAKGREVYTEGRLQTREWTDRDGNKRYTTEVVANQVTFLGSRADTPSAGGNGRSSYSGATSEAGATSPADMGSNGHTTPTSYSAASSSPPAGKTQDSNFDYGPPPPDDDVPF